MPSGVKLSGPLIICLTPAVSSAGTRAIACAHVLLEMVPVVVEQLELEIVGHVARCVQAMRVRLVAAHHQPADLFLEIGAPVGIADGRRVGREARRSFR